MQITEERIVINSNWFSPERDIKRTPGLHLSHVINFIEDNASGKPRKQDLDMMNNYACAGFLWERVLEKVIECDPWQLWEWLFSRAMVDVEDPKIIRPGEQHIKWECPECTGKECKVCGGTGVLRVFMTPDGFHLDDACLEEWKYTSKSVKNGITHPKFKRWLDYQIPVYLKALGLLRCRLRVYFSRGDYTTGEPIWMQYMITYTQDEVDETWEMVRLNAEYMIVNGMVKPHWK